MLGVARYTSLTKEVVASELRNVGVWTLDYRFVSMLTPEMSEREESQMTRTTLVAIYSIAELLDEYYSDHVMLIADIKDIFSTRRAPKSIAQQVIQNTYLQKVESLGYTSGATLKCGAAAVYRRHKNALKDEMMAKEQYQREADCEERKKKAAFKKKVEEKCRNRII